MLKDWILVLTTIITTVATVIYAILSYKMLKQMDKNNKLSQEPLVYVYVEDENWDDFYIKIENVGRGIAYNISFSFEPDFNYPKYNYLISEHPIFRHTKQLKPSQNNRTYLEGNTYFNNPEMPKVFFVNVTYEDIYKQKFEQKWELSTDMYRNRLHVNKKTSSS